MDTPECDKIQKAKGESHAIGEFMDWLRDEKNVVLATYHEHSEEECGSTRWPECGIYSEQPVVFHYNMEQLLAEFFEIDLNVVEQERQALLEQQRALNEGRCPHGEPLGECNACDVAGDLAFDAAREDERFGR